MTPAVDKDAQPGRLSVESRALFGTPIAAAALPNGPQLNGPLQAEIDRLYRADGSHDASAVWSSAPDRPGPGDPASYDLCRAACILIAGISGRAEAERPDRWRIERRCHRLTHGQSVAVHSHPATAWEASYIVACDTGAGGELEFQDPRGAAPVMYAPHLTFKMPGAETLGVSQTVSAKPGLLAVYPGWLMHGVAFYRSGAPRLSMTLRFSPQEAAAP